jgi:hypothetical protein
MVALQPGRQTLKQEVILNALVNRVNVRANGKGHGWYPDVSQEGGLLASELVGSDVARELSEPECLLLDRLQQVVLEVAVKEDLRHIDGGVGADEPVGVKLIPEAPLAGSDVNVVNGANVTLNGDNVDAVRMVGGNVLAQQADSRIGPELLCETGAVLIIDEGQVTVSVVGGAREATSENKLLVDAGGWANVGCSVCLFLQTNVAA